MAASVEATATRFHMKRQQPLREGDGGDGGDAEKRYFEATRAGDWKGALAVAMAAPEGDAQWNRRREVASKVVAGAFLPRGE